MDFYIRIYVYYVMEGPLLHVSKEILGFLTHSGYDRLSRGKSSRSACSDTSNLIDLIGAKKCNQRLTRLSTSLASIIISSLHSQVVRQVAVLQVRSFRRLLSKMKFTQATKWLLLLGACEAFAPASRFAVPRTDITRSARSMAVDPNFFNDMPSHVQSLQHAFSTLSLSDAMDAMDSLPDPSAVVEEAAKDNNGWFGFLTGPTILLLQGIHSLLVSVGMSADAWGVSIIVMTLVIKIATFPLTKTQLESTNKMQVSIFCRTE